MPDLTCTDDWVVDSAAAFRRAYAQYRKMADTAEAEIRRRLPCWQVEIREHRSGSFEVLLCPPHSEPRQAKVFYLTPEQAASTLQPDFKADPRDFFGFNLLRDEDFKA